MYYTKICLTDTIKIAEGNEFLYFEVPVSYLPFNVIKQPVKSHTLLFYMLLHQSILSSIQQLQFADS